MTAIEPSTFAMLLKMNRRINLPVMGATVEFVRPDGVSGRAVVEEMKEHGDGRSFFFGSLSKDDIPIGSVVYWMARDVNQSVGRLRLQTAPLDRR